MGAGWFRATPIATRLLTRRPWLLWAQLHLDLVDPKRFDVIVAGWNTRYVSSDPVPAQSRSIERARGALGHGHSSARLFSNAHSGDFVANLATALIFYGHTGCSDSSPATVAQRAFVALNTLDQSEIQAACKGSRRPGFRRIPNARTAGQGAGPSLFRAWSRTTARTS